MLNNIVQENNNPQSLHFRVDVYCRFYSRNPDNLNNMSAVKELTAMLETLTKENWTEHLGEDFQVDTGNTDSLIIKLTAVSGYGQRQGGNREAFSLLFCGPPQPVLPQRIYRITHPGMGELDIFLVPVGPLDGGMGYEAVFT